VCNIVVELGAVSIVSVAFVTWSNEATVWASSNDRVLDASVVALVWFPVRAESNACLLVDSTQGGNDSFINVSNENSVKMDIVGRLKIDSDCLGSKET
jgi:hypothetical protein